MDDDNSLRDQFLQCNEAYKRLHSIAQQQFKDDLHVLPQLVNQYDRLGLWAHDVKIMNGSLDDQLQSNSALSSCVAEMLHDLQEQLRSMATASTDLSALVEEVTDIIDSLISLEPTLKSPPPLDEITGKTLRTSVPERQDETAHFEIIANNVRYTSGKPDLDIVVIPGFQLENLTPYGELNMLIDVLPSVLEENGIYARVLVANSHTQLHPSHLANDEAIRPLINKYVKYLNRARYQDPERSLQFLGHSIGTFIAKGVATTLALEGLVVDTNRPICGCTFLQTSSGDGSEAITSWFDTVFGGFLSPENARELSVINREFERAAQAQKIEVFLPEVTSGVRTRDDQLPLIHRIARMAESVMSSDYSEDVTPTQLLKGNAGSETARKADEFAILNGYDTAILVNDCSSFSEEIHSSIIDIVRDCVDTVLLYQEDMDIQLSSAKNQCFSVQDSSKAARLLASWGDTGEPWSFSAALSTYLKRYATSPSSNLPNGALRPCNLIVFTASAPEDYANLLPTTISDMINLLRTKRDQQLSVCIQIVLLGADPAANKYFDIFDSTAREFGTPIAPTFRLPYQYTSNSDVCKRILLGPISPRFAAISFSTLEASTAHAMFMDTVADDASTILSRGTSEIGRTDSLISTPTVYGSEFGFVSSQDDQRTADTEFATQTSKGTTSEFSQHGNMTANPLWESSKTPGADNHDFDANAKRSNMDTDTASLHRDPLEKGRRSSTSIVPSIDRIRAMQRHPATFQCNLCPKKFTRAYNLRSHLRTHMDERPFVCSICGKAFARQHDRKRHEGLHSGEKKFVCRGVLKNGSSWGCGRRFAQVTALGRHFQSEAGRVCIRSLLEEEEEYNRECDTRASDTGEDIESDAVPFPLPLLAQYPELRSMPKSEVLDNTFVDDDSLTYYYDGDIEMGFESD